MSASQQQNANGTAKKAALLGLVLTAAMVLTGNRIISKIAADQPPLEQGKLLNRMVINIPTPSQPPANFTLPNGNKITITSQEVLADETARALMGPMEYQSSTRGPYGSNEKMTAQYRTSSGAIVDLRENQDGVIDVLLCSQTKEICQASISFKPFGSENGDGFLSITEDRSTINFAGHIKRDERKVVYSERTNERRSGHGSFLQKSRPESGLPKDMLRVAQIVQNIRDGAAFRIEAKATRTNDFVHRRAAQLFGIDSQP